MAHDHNSSWLAGYMEKATTEKAIKTANKISSMFIQAGTGWYLTRCNGILLVFFNIIVVFVVVVVVIFLGFYVVIGVYDGAQVTKMCISLPFMGKIGFHNKGNGEFWTFFFL